MQIQLRTKQNYAGIALAIIIASFFLFPIGFRGLPESLNTKQMLAIVGVFGFGLKCAKSRTVSFNRTTLTAFVIACVFSVWCFFSTVANNTSDYAYATYFLSFTVWLGAAYATCFFIKSAYGKVDLRTLTKVMALVCVLQCISALLVDNVAWFRNFVDTWIIQDTVPKRVKRLYGLGISLDSGAVRLCMALMLIAHQLASRTPESLDRRSVWTYSIAFAFISIVGSMIARTTWVGMGLGLIYIICRKMSVKLRRFQRNMIVRFFIAIAFLIGIIVLMVYFYRTDSIFRNYLRFGFEAFFNFFEHGEFRTSSTDRLNEVMWVWPWSREGWLIGYGNFDSGHWGRFMSDIGYCRFFLYCGLIGFSIFSTFFIFLARAMSEKFKDSTFFFILIGLMTFIIWIKVSTDLFQLYALLMCLPASKKMVSAEND